MGPLRKVRERVEKKPERAKVTREEFIDKIKKADEWRKARLAEIKKPPR